MLPTTHIISGLIFSVVLFLFFPQIGFLGLLIIFLSSFLIDVDHYFYYVYKKRDLSLKKSIKWYYLNIEKFKKMSQKQKDNIFMGICLFHGIETIIILFLLYIISPIFNFLIFIILGFIFHQILDAIELKTKGVGYSKVISFIYAIHKIKGKKLLQDLN